MLKHTPLLALIALAGCQKPINVGPPPPPAEKLVCKDMPEKPELDALEAVTTDSGAVVYSKAQTDARDAVIASYIVELRGSFFDCKSQLGWVKKYYDEQ